MNTKEFDLNIEKVLENWTISHAIREVISNALDEQIITNSKKIDIYCDESNTWHIRDYGRGLNYTHLTQNENEEKLNHPNLIGKFGVGLKDALATFDRHAVSIIIDSKYGRITLGKSEKHGFEDITTLHAYINDSKDKGFLGTDFQMRGCTKTDIENAKQLFLCFRKMQQLETTQFGEIYEKVSEKAEIFINGVKVSEEDNFLFSYNITSLNASIKKALNRERTNVGRSAYTDRVKDILLNSESKMVISLLTNNLNELSQGTIKDELKWKDVAEFAVKRLNVQNDVVFVSPRDFEALSGDTIDILRQSGKKIIYIPENIKARVETSYDVEGGKIETVATILENYRESFEYKFVPYEKLTNDEKKVFDMSFIIIRSYKADHLMNKIAISETIKPDLYGDASVGVWDSELEKVIIRRDQLKSKQKFLGVLIHELIHAHKDLIDVTRQFELEMTRIIGILSAEVFDGTTLLKIS